MTFLNENKHLSDAQSGFSRDQDNGMGHSRKRRGVDAEAFIRGVL